MRIFVSYARIDKPYCIQIVDTLDVHDVWYDQRLYAGQEWWKEILRRLDWCEGFIFLLSPYSVTSQYCMQEYELAKSLGRHIIPVMIQDGTPLPEGLEDMQYVDLSGGLTMENVKMLLNSIYVAERVPGNVPVSDISSDVVKPPSSSPSHVIREAITAMEKNNYDQAVFLLRQAKSNGFDSRFINLEALLSEAEKSLEHQSYLREAEREYRQIVELMRFNKTRQLGCEAFRSFLQYFPDYDPDDLAEQCDAYLKDVPATVEKSNGANKPKPIAKPIIDFKLPHLDWCEVSSGAVHVNLGQSATVQIFQVKPFQISKYPVTNAQYQVFIDDADGYRNETWWDFSTVAQAWRENHPTARPSRFRGDERPREMVTWYDAMAFCRWLSAKLGKNITLPTLMQWQQAAQGGDNRIYPWGNVFDQNRCNTRESSLKMTTQVSRYKDGVSPFGVYDMAGNVWEWCLNGENEYDTVDITAETKRVVKGGSYVSACERSQNQFYYHIQPETIYGSIGFRLVQP